MAQEPQKPGTELGRSLGPMFLSQLFSLTWLPHPRDGQAPISGHGKGQMGLQVTPGWEGVKVAHPFALY